MVNILFTGGAGFIGSSIIDKLNKKKYNIYVVDNLLTGKYKNIPLSNFRLGSLSKKYISEFTLYSNSFTSIL